jgi:alpha-glucosidase
MQWDAGPNAGFCPPNIEPWLPIAPDYQRINVAVEREDPSSLLALTRALLALRRNKPALQQGSYHALEGGSENCFIYLRQFERERLVIALNFSQEAEQVRIPNLGEGQMLLSTSLERAEPIKLADFRLGGHEGCIIQLRDGEDKVVR